MHDRGTGEIDEPHAPQPTGQFPRAQPGPCPAAKNRINQTGNDKGDNEVGGEAYSFGNRSRRNRAGGTAKYQLKEKKCLKLWLGGEEKEVVRFCRFAYAGAKHYCEATNPEYR